MKQMGLAERLKEIANEINLSDFIKLRAYLEKEGKYLPECYKKPFLASSMDHFYRCWKKARDIDFEELKELSCGMEWKDLSSFLGKMDMEEGIKKILSLTALYTTLIEKTPIHPLNIPLPGGEKIYERDGIYICPIKKKHEEDKNALCRFCVAFPENFQRNVEVF